MYIIFTNFDATLRPTVLIAVTDICLLLYIISTNSDAIPLLNIISLPSHRSHESHRTHLFLRYFYSSTFILRYIFLLYWYTLVLQIQNHIARILNYQNLICIGHRFCQNSYYKISVFLQIPQNSNIDTNFIFLVVHRYGSNICSIFSMRCYYSCTHCDLLHNKVCTFQSLSILSKQ